MTRIDLHRIFFMHALLAILRSDDGDITMINSGVEWRERQLKNGCQNSLSDCTIRKHDRVNERERKAALLSES